MIYPCPTVFHYDDIRKVLKINGILFKTLFTDFWEDAPILWNKITVREKATKTYSLIPREEDIIELSPKMREYKLVEVEPLKDFCLYSEETLQCGPYVITLYLIKTY